MSTTPDRVAVETPRGTVRTGRVVDARPRTVSDRLERELLVDLGAARLWVPADQTTTP